MKTASLTLLELERWLALQIAGVYRHTMDSALDQTPATAWQHGLAQRPRSARQPQDRERFFLGLCPSNVGRFGAASAFFTCTIGTTYSVRGLDVPRSVSLSSTILVTFRESIGRISRATTGQFRTATARYRRSACGSMTKSCAH
jgi:hypothetical protein